MIPIIHQGLHILALGPRGPAEERSDAPGFLAALAAQDDSPSPPDTADACFAAGMVMPAQPILQTEPILATKAEAAEPILTAPPISTSDPATTHSTEASPSALTATPTVPQTTPIFTTVPLVLTQKNQSQPATFGAVEIPATSISEPNSPLATDEASPPVTPPEKPRGASPTKAVTRAVNDPAPLLTPTSQNASTLARNSIAAPAVIIAKTSAAAAVLASQITAAEIIVQTHTADQPTDRPTPINHPTMTPAPRRAEPNASPLQAFPPHALPNQIPEDQATSAQILPVQTQPVQTIPAQTLLAQTKPDRIPEDQTRDTPQSPVPEHKPSISPAESAWQTRLQVAVPFGSLPKPNISADRMRVDARASQTDSPKVDSPAPATAAPAPDSICLKTLVPPNPPANLAPIPQAADSPNLRIPKADIAPAQQPAAPASAQLSPAMTPKPTADAAVTPHPPAALPDQTTLQPVSDQTPPQANPILPQPIPPHQTGQTQSLPPSLATAVPAQLLHHTTAAKTGGVDVLLQPEELGHVKFQIQQHGETVRILLSAERPETLDLLRRHSDQLLQEFRQSGFSQASLNFSQWGQNQRSPTPPPELVAAFDADFVEPPPTPRPISTAAVAPSGQGLNLRL